MRIALLTSGGGTTAEAILRACADGRLQGVVPACVIASKPDIPGIARAKAMGVPDGAIHVIVPKTFETREAFGEEMLRALRSHEVNFVGQYGWNPQTPVNVVEAYRGMFVNQHPGPLDYPRPDFGGKGMYGRRVHCARLLFVRRVGRDFWTEATAHRVTANLDEGAVLRREVVPIEPDDTVDSLQARMLPIEHKVQIEMLHDFAEGAVQEMIRVEPLVRPEEENILEECKAEAIRQYPNG